MDVGSILLGSGGSAILLSMVQALINRRKLGADTAAVLSDTARELVQPLRERITEMADENRRLRHRVEDMEADLRWLRAERADQIRRDAAMQNHIEALAAWVDTWLPQARALGLLVPDPPRPPHLPKLIDPELIQPRRDKRREVDP